MPSARLSSARLIEARTVRDCGPCACACKLVPVCELENIGTENRTVRDCGPEPPLPSPSRPKSKPPKRHGEARSASLSMTFGPMPGSD